MAAHLRAATIYYSKLSSISSTTSPIYKYIYIYIEREREREREGVIVIITYYPKELGGGQSSSPHDQ